MVEKIEIVMGSRPRDTLEDGINQPKQQRSGNENPDNNLEIVEHSIGNGKKLYLFKGE